MERLLTSEFMLPPVLNHLCRICHSCEAVRALVAQALHVHVTLNMIRSKSSKLFTENFLGSISSATRGSLVDLASDLLFVCLGMATVCAPVPGREVLAALLARHEASRRRLGAAARVLGTAAC